MNINSLTRNDLKVICRICLLHQKSLISISTITDAKYVKILDECIPVHDSTCEPYPHQICESCLARLKIVYEFKENCIYATKILQSILSPTNEEPSEPKPEPEPGDICQQPERLKLESKNPNLAPRKIKKLRKTYKYSCSECDKGFNYLSTLGAHCKGSHKATPITCPNCPSIFHHQLQLKQHLNTHESRGYVCDICGKTFSRQYKLKYHQSAHSEARPFKCSICNTGFKQKFNLKIHIKIRHEERDRREICNICGKLILPVSFRAHLESHKSLDERSFSCSQCDKIYASKTALRTHVNEKHNIETIPETFTCKLCGKVLVSKRTLSKHVTIVHSEVKKIECHICGKKYKLQSHVKAHVLSAHLDVRPHECSTCNKAFHTKALLKNHIRTHTGERPFSCTVCEKTFGFKNVLNTHMKIHAK